MRLTHLQAQLVTAQVCRGETFLAVGSGSVHHVQDKVWPPLCVVYHHHVAVLTLECLLGEGLLGGIDLSTDHSSCHTPRAVGRCQNSIPRSGRGLVRGVSTCFPRHWGIAVSSDVRTLDTQPTSLIPLRKPLHLICSGP